MYKTIQNLIGLKTKLTGQCETPTEYRYMNFMDLSNEQLSCYDINPKPQNMFFTELKQETITTTTTTTTSTTTITTTTVENM